MAPTWHPRKPVLPAGRRSVFIPLERIIEMGAESADAGLSSMKMLKLTYTHPDGSKRLGVLWVAGGGSAKAAFDPDAWLAAIERLRGQE